MSLRRAVKAVGFKDFMRMGLALTTSREMAIAPTPKTRLKDVTRLLKQTS